MKTIIGIKDYKNSIKELSKVKNESKLSMFDNIKILSDNDNTYIVKQSLNNQLKIKVESEILESGQVVLNDKESKILTKLKSGALQIENDVITNGNKKIQIDNSEFSDEIKLEECKDQFKVSQNELLRLLKVSYARAEDEERPILQGVYFKENKVYALDGYRLSKRTTTEYKCNSEFVINYLGVDILINCLKNSIKNKPTESVSICVYDKHVLISFAEYEMTLALLEGTYVNVESIVEGSSYEYREKIKILESNKLLESVEFIKESNIDNDYMAISINNNKIILSNRSNRSNSVSVTEEIDYANVIKNEGEFKIGVNPRYVIEAIKNCYKGSEFNMMFVSPVNPIYLSKNDMDNIDMILPIRLIK